MTLPLVLIPGMMCDARLWRSQLVAFSRDRAVHIASITQHDTVSALAADILAHAPARFALAGLSMGGIVAMEVIRQAPERVAKIALLDTNPHAEIAEVQAARSPQMERARKGEFLDVMREAMIPRYLHDDTQGTAREALETLAVSMASSLGSDTFIKQSLALRDRPDQVEALGNIDVPALILTGDQDRLCPMDRHELMAARIPNARLAVIKGAGHLPVLEKPKETNAELTAWLST